MWQNLRLETFVSLLESIVIFKIAFDSFFFPLYGYRLGFIFPLSTLLNQPKSRRYLRHRTLGFSVCCFLYHTSAILKW